MDDAEGTEDHISNRGLKNQTRFVGSISNINTVQGQRFMLERHAHPNKFLQAEWKAFRGDAFMFDAEAKARCIRQSDRFSEETERKMSAATSTVRGTADNPGKLDQSMTIRSLSTATKFLDMLDVTKGAGA